MAVERIQWTCPVCKRRYAIPATAPTPARCPQCRQAEEQSKARGVHAPVLAEAIAEPLEQAEEESSSALAPAFSVRPPPLGSSSSGTSGPLSALAAIQLEVAEEASRGPSAVAPVVRQIRPAFNRLEAIATIYTVLAGLAVVGGFAGLLFGLRAAFVMEATVLRTYAIFYALGEFIGGLVAALAFFAFREVIYLLLAIEENTRPRQED
ncbi:MAG TPA: hypothetical protein VEI07_14410 [Planctomycetaceae bacterium]|nr:hypothetical protein [Planctomycetaceae bacterium]